MGGPLPEPPDWYETIAGERRPRFCAAESSDGSVRELRAYADATFGILRRPGGEVVILSPAVPLSSLMVLGLCRLLAGPLPHEHPWRCRPQDHQGRSSGDRDGIREKVPPWPGRQIEVVLKEHLA